MAKLSTGVVVTHPKSGEPTFLPGGSELPEWADGLVGDHALEAEAKASPEKELAEAEAKAIPEKELAGKYAELTVEALKAAIAERNEARQDDIKVVPVGSKKADLIAALEADDEAKA